MLMNGTAELGIIITKVVVLMQPAVQIIPILKAVT